LYNHISCTGVFYDKYLKPNKIKMRGTHKFKNLEVKDIRQRALLEAYASGNLCPAHFGTGAKNIGK
jgi:tRNA splicing ligase